MFLQIVQGMFFSPSSIFEWKNNSLHCTVNTGLVAHIDFITFIAPLGGKQCLKVFQNSKRRSLGKYLEEKPQMAGKEEQKPTFLRERTHVRSHTHANLP